MCVYILYVSIKIAVTTYIEEEKKIRLKLKREKERDGKKNVYISLSII